MSFSINRVTLVGNLARDVELRYTQSGTAVAQTTIVTNESRKKGDGWEDIPTFHRLVIWGKTAEWVSKMGVKGMKFYVDGRITNSSYEKDGVTHYKSEITVLNAIPMSGAKKTAPASGGEATTEELANTSTQMDEVNVEDIPF